MWNSFALTINLGPKRLLLEQYRSKQWTSFMKPCYLMKMTKLLKAFNTRKLWALSFEFRLFTWDFLHHFSKSKFFFTRTSFNFLSIHSLSVKGFNSINVISVIVKILRLIFFQEKLFNVRDDTRIRTRRKRRNHKYILWQD